MSTAIETAAPATDLQIPENILESGEALKVYAHDLRTMRQRHYDELRRATQPSDVRSWHERHTEKACRHADIIEEKAVDMIVTGTEERVLPNGQVHKGELSPGGLKILSGVLREASEMEGTALGKPTKVSGNVSHHTTLRGQVQSSVVHATGRQPGDDFEIEPPEDDQGSGAIDGEIVDAHGVQSTQ